MRKKNSAELLSNIFAVTFSLDILIIILHILFSQYSSFLNLDREYNLPTLYQSLKLLFIASMLALAAWKVRDIKAQSSILPLFAIMSLGFAFLSFDELFVIHEQVELISQGYFPDFTNTFLQTFFNLGFKSSVWLLFYIPVFIAAIFLLLYIKKVWQFFSSLQRKYMKLGVCLFGLVLVMEVLNSQGNIPNIVHFILITLEESFELFGATVFLYVAGLAASSKKK